MGLGAKSPLLIGFLVAFLLFQTTSFEETNAQTAKVIPPWFKIAALFWTDGLTSDGEFANALEWLIRNELIVSPNLTLVEIAESGFVSQDDVKVPDWIKDYARYWVLGAISDKDFLNNIEYLFKEKIITSSRIVVTVPPESDQFFENDVFSTQLLLNEIKVLAGKSYTFELDMTSYVSPLDVKIVYLLPDSPVSVRAVEFATDVSHKGNFNSDERTVTYSLNGMTSGETLEITVSTSDLLRNGDVLSNVITVVGEYTSQNNQKKSEKIVIPFNMPVFASADIGIVDYFVSTRDDPFPVDPGLIDTTSIVFKNDGPSTAEDVVVRIHVPDWIELTADEDWRGDFSFDRSTGVGEYYLGQVRPSDEDTFLYPNYRISETAPIEEIGEVVTRMFSSDVTFDPKLGDNTITQYFMHQLDVFVERGPSKSLGKLIEGKTPMQEFEVDYKLRQYHPQTVYQNYANKVVTFEVSHLDKSKIHTARTNGFGQVSLDLTGLPGQSYTVKIIVPELVESVQTNRFTAETIGEYGKHDTITVKIPCGKPETKKPTLDPELRESAGFIFGIPLAYGGGASSALDKITERMEQRAEDAKEDPCPPEEESTSQWSLLYYRKDLVKTEVEPGDTFSYQFKISNTGEAKSPKFNFNFNVNSVKFVDGTLRQIGLSEGILKKAVTPLSCVNLLKASSCFLENIPKGITLVTINFRVVENAITGKTVVGSVSLEPSENNKHTLVIVGPKIVYNEEGLPQEEFLQKTKDPTLEQVQKCLSFDEGKYKNALGEGWTPYCVTEIKIEKIKDHCGDGIHGQYPIYMMMVLDETGSPLEMSDIESAISDYIRYEYFYTLSGGYETSQLYQKYLDESGVYKTRYLCSGEKINLYGNDYTGYVGTLDEYSYQLP